MKRYLIIIEKGVGDYGAYCPDLPGCISTGDTVEETTKNMQEAIQFHLDGMREDGLPIPEPTTVDDWVTVSVA